MIHHGDCLDVLATLAPDSLDACVTDPPYGLAFMGKDWDHGLPGTAFWAAVMRVLKPGAHLLAFGGTRTYHRLACAIEDAGFEVRDCLMWVYGSGFPKSLNLGNGWGTALKPAYEPIILARKPLAGTVAANVARYGTGAINVDGCRIGSTVETWPVSRSYAPGQIQPGGRGKTQPTGPVPSGRWPANLLLDEDAAAALDAQSGERRSAGDFPSKSSTTNNVYGKRKGQQGPLYADSGGASRFFYVAKASRAERERGLDDLPEVRRSDGREKDIENPRLRTSERRNHHPTIKPIALMRYLVRLVTPPGGTVLDPFLGSGTTLVAAKLEGVKGVGIEREAEYVAIAEARVAAGEERIYA